MIRTKWQEWEEASGDESRWRDHEERGLIKAEHVHDYVLRLWFEEDLDVTIYELDFEPLLVAENPGGVFEALRDPDRFRLAAGHYALVWLNPVTGEYDGEAIDVAPECIRFFCERYGRLLKTAGKAAA